MGVILKVGRRDPTAERGSGATRAGFTRAHARGRIELSRRAVASSFLCFRALALAWSQDAQSTGVAKFCPQYPLAYFEFIVNSSCLHSRPTV